MTSLIFNVPQNQNLSIYGPFIICTYCIIHFIKDVGLFGLAADFAACDNYNLCLPKSWLRLCLILGVVLRC